MGIQQRFLISGATGLIGSELALTLRMAGASVTTLTRSNPGVDQILWESEAGVLDPRLVSGFDAVIHLAGEPVGTGRWTAEKKRKIYNSRIHGTQTLAGALALAAEPPRVFLCASGINYYPSSGGRILDESSDAGGGFLSKVCVDWERCAEALGAVSRVVTMRTGVVLSVRGGTLAKMLPVFRLGLGGYVGAGGNYLSWITLSDLIRAVLHILRSTNLRGPVNMVSPEPITGRTFAEAVGIAVDRPPRLRIPEFLLRLALGEFAEETILSSVRAVPAKLISDGFTFQSQTIQEALVGSV